jgi:pimeloyl-ACP methyl ester carboxylesterase
MPPASEKDNKNKVQKRRRKMRKINILFLLSMLIILTGRSSKDSKKDVYSGGVKIHYTVEGKGEPALVFIHGWCCDGEVWKYQVPYFSKNYTVVTIDLGGHGKSGHNRNDWTMEMFGQDVKAVADKLGLNKVILIGHSMGGPVIVAAQRLMPEKVVALVGADTFHNIEEGYTGEQMAQIISNMQRDFKNQMDIFVRNMFPADADPNLVDWVATKMVLADPNVAIGSLRSLGTYSMIEPLSDTNVPVYSISADFWPTDFEVNKKYIKSFEVKMMPGVGHFVMLEDPDKFNGYLSEIINQL